MVFWTQNQQRTHHKVGTARPPKAIHTAIYAKGACPYTHRATHNRHTKCAGLPWWLFGSRRARIVCRGSPHTFCTKPAVFRAHPCQVDNDAGRAARINCYGSLGALVLSSHNSLSGRRVQRHCQLGMDVLELQQFLSFVPYAWYKTYGRPSADDPCTPRAEGPPRQPRTLSATVVGYAMGIWARTLRVDRGMDSFRGPSDAHFVVCSLLVLGPKYQILPSMRFCATETHEDRNA